MPFLSIWYLPARRSCSASNPIYGPSAITLNLSTITRFRRHPFLITVWSMMTLSSTIASSSITRSRRTTAREIPHARPLYQDASTTERAKAMGN